MLAKIVLHKSIINMSYCTVSNGKYSYYYKTKEEDNKYINSGHFKIFV